MSAPTNFAAWQVGPKTSPLEIKPAAYPVPGPNQLIMKNHAVAINPIDPFFQAMGPALFPDLQYPSINGMDCSGVIVDIGSPATKFKLGDRVAGLAVGGYTVLQENTTAKIPETVTYEQGSVVPVGVCTAAAGLFEKDQLGLQYPSLARKETGKCLLIWGGASSVGCCAIQLAIAAGYEVFTTCSPRNFSLVIEELGASKAFDYNSSTVVADITDALKGKELVGIYDIMGAPRGAFAPCCEILLAVTGSKGGYIASAMHPPESEVPEGIESRFVNMLSVKENEIGGVVFDYVEKALERGTFKAKPEASVVSGKGLEAIQEGLERCKEGVSAKKVVVSLV